MVPSDIRGDFNWGAFLLNWIWTVGNTSCGFALLSFVLSYIPFINIGWAIYLGRKGNVLAWKSKRWDSPGHFRNTQRTWARVGIALWLVAVLLTCLLAFLMGAGSLLDGGSGDGARWL